MFKFEKKCLIGKGDIAFAKNLGGDGYRVFLSKGGSVLTYDVSSAAFDAMEGDSPIYAGEIQVTSDGKLMRVEFGRFGEYSV